jgi:hypothetical protein
MHGARGGARPGPDHPNWKHGGRSSEATAVRKLLNDLSREAQKLRDIITSD